MLGPTRWEVGCGGRGDSVVGPFWCPRAAPAPSSLTSQASVPSRDPAGVVTWDPSPDTAAARPQPQPDPGSPPGKPSPTLAEGVSSPRRREEGSAWAMLGPCRGPCAPALASADQAPGTLVGPPGGAGVPTRAALFPGWVHRGVWTQEPSSALILRVCPLTRLLGQAFPDRGHLLSSLPSSSRRSLNPPGQAYVHFVPCVPGTQARASRGVLSANADTVTLARATPCPRAPTSRRTASWAGRRKGLRGPGAEGRGPGVVRTHPDPCLLHSLP